MREITIKQKKQNEQTEKEKLNQRGRNKIRDLFIIIINCNATREFILQVKIKEIEKKRPGVVNLKWQIILHKIRHKSITYTYHRQWSNLTNT